MLEAKTLDELKDGLLASYARLDSLGIFKTIEFLADAGPDVRSLAIFPRSLFSATASLTLSPTRAPQDVPNSANIAITVEEKPVLGFHAGTYVQVRAR